MKRLLLQPLASFTLPNAANANEKVLSEMSDIEAKKILHGEVLSECYAVDRNHISMKQKIDILGFSLNFHEHAHGNKKNIQKDHINAVWKVLDIVPDCFPEVKKR